MAKLITLESNKTYATEANAIKAAQAKFGNNESLRFFITQNKEGRFFPVFLGEVALRNQAHFHFPVVG